MARQEASLAAAPWDVGDYFSIGGSGRVVSSRGLSIHEALLACNVTILLSPTNRASDALVVMAQADVAIACAGGSTSEGLDRPSLALDAVLARLPCALQPS